MDKEIPTQKRVAIYIRVSTEEQVERYGRDLQEDAVQAMIRSKAGSDEPFIFAGEDHIYFDDGISGTVELGERPAFARLMEAVMYAQEGQRPFDAVAVYKIDRFARKLTILLDAISFFNQYDVQFISVNESIDTSTAFGRAMLGIIGVIAELERDTIYDRTQAGRAQALAKGVHMGNAPKYGYVKDDSKRLVILDEEAETVRLVFQMLTSSKMSVYNIADWLKKNEYLTPDASSVVHKKRKGDPKNKKSIHNWHPENVRRMLQDEIYVGRAYYNKTKNGKKIPKSEWFVQHVPQIIDEVTFAKAQKILKENKHQKKETPSKHVYLLSGLLRCEACRSGDSVKHFAGVPKPVKSTGKKVYYYSCKGKSHLYKDNPCLTTPVPADAIEDYVLNVCKKILKNPVDTFEYQQKLKSTRVEIRHLQKEEERVLKLVESVPARKAMLREQHEAGLIDLPALKERVEEVNQKEKEHKEQLKDIQMRLSQNTLNEGYIETFKLFSEKYQTMLEKVTKNRPEVYDLIHAMIEEITVYSRPVRESDKIAGRKKEGQQVPNRIHIKFKLPQEMLNVFGHQKAEIIEKAPLSDASSSQKDVSGAR